MELYVDWVMYDDLLKSAEKICHLKSIFTIITIPITVLNIEKHKMSWFYNKQTKAKNSTLWNSCETS